MTVQATLRKRFEENQSRYKARLDTLTSDGVLKTKINITLKRLSNTLASDNPLNVEACQSIKGLLDAMTIVSLSINKTNPNLSYQKHFNKAFIDCLGMLTEEASTPFTQQEIKSIRDTLVTPLHLKVAKRNLIEGQTIKIKLTEEMRDEMFAVLDSIIPQEKKVSIFDFFGDGQKGQSLRQLLNTLHSSEVNEVLDVFKNIVFEAARHRFRKQGEHSCTTGTASKILEALAQKEHSDLRLAFFGKKDLSREQLACIFDDIIKEKNPNYPPPYSGI